jgi:hypothetical protein
MAMEAVGLGTWDQLPEDEKQKLVDMEIWKSEVKSRWLAEINGEDIDGGGDDGEDEDDDSAPDVPLGKNLKGRLSGKDKKKKRA